MAADTLLGQVIRGYRIDTRIGTGGFGIVYRAVQESTGRLVAIKVISPEYIALHGFLERFKQEANLIARLEHPYIVPLIDSWVMPDAGAFLAMRYFSAGSLRDVLNQQKPMTIESVIRIAAQIADALSLAHLHGIIHRDLKPDNILLDEHQNAYLTDFGIAKDLMTNTNITTQGAPPLSPRYAAPEQFGGAVVPQSDLYSLALTMYECLTGKYPFPDTPMMRFTMPMPMPPTPLHPLLYSVFLQATQPNPLARQPSVLAFADDLTRASAATLPVAPPIQPPMDAATQIDYRAVTPRSSQTQPGTSGHANPTPAGQSHGIPVSALLLRQASHITWRPQKLIGRSDLVASLLKRLHEQDRVLLQGFSGTGKTVLAAECAVRFLNEGQSPVLWVEIADAAVNIVQEAIARPFGSHESLRKLTADKERQQFLRELLSEKKVRLVVFDNAWCEGKALKQLVDGIPTDIAVLVTSQQKYPMGRTEHIEMLPLNDALALLSFYSGLPLSLENEDATRLCHQLDYHPFALEIAGKTLAAEEIAPEALLWRMANDAHTLIMPSGYAEEGRQSVKDLLDTSVGQLPSVPRTVFLACGTFFMPSITPDLLALALGQQPEETDNHLQDIVRRGLLNVSSLEGRSIYRLHTLAFAYARANASLSAAQGIAACQRYAKQFEDDSAAIAAERNNLLHAASMAQRRGDNESLIEILRSFTVDGSYLRERGHDRLLLEQLDAAVSAARDDSKTDTLQALVGKLGNIYAERGEFEQAATCYQEYIAIACAQGNKIREAHARAVLSHVYGDMGQFADAQRELTTASTIADELDDKSLHIRILENQGNLYAAQAQLQDALVSFSDNVVLARQSNEVDELLRALINLGAVQHDLHSYQQAVQTFLEALAIHNEFLANELGIKAHILFSLAMTRHEMEGRTTESYDRFNEALAIMRLSGNMVKIREIEVYLRDHEYSIL